MITFNLKPHSCCFGFLLRHATDRQLVGEPNYSAAAVKDRVAAAALAVRLVGVLARATPLARRPHVDRTGSGRGERSLEYTM